MPGVQIALMDQGSVQISLPMVFFNHLMRAKLWARGFQICRCNVLPQYMLSSKVRWSMLRATNLKAIK